MAFCEINLLSEWRKQYIPSTFFNLLKLSFLDNTWNRWFCHESNHMLWVVRRYLWASGFRKTQSCPWNSSEPEDPRNVAFHCNAQSSKIKTCLQVKAAAQRGTLTQLIKAQTLKPSRWCARPSAAPSGLCGLGNIALIFQCFTFIWNYVPPQCCRENETANICKALEQCLE